MGTEGKDMKVFIKPGYAWIEGYLYKIDTESLALEHGTADPEFNRIDRVVIRLDKSLEKRYVRAFILKGIPAEEPVPAKLTRNDNIYEISLAQVEVIAGKSFIESYQITDERVNNEVCGLVTHLFEQVNTTEIFNQFQDWLKIKTSEPDGEFYREWKDWFDEIQDDTNLVTKTTFDIHEDDYINFKNTTNIELDKISKKLDNYSSHMSDEDINGVFKVVEYKRLDGTLYMKSILSNPDSKGNYRNNTWEFYDETGLNRTRTINWMLTFDKNNRLVSKEVVL